MKRILRKISGKGDETVAEWDTETASPEALKKIEDEFNAKMAEGYFAADLDKQELIKRFDPNVNIMLIPKMQGGC